MRNSLRGPRGKPPRKPSGRPLATPAMPPARLGSEKADRVIGDRWTKEGLTAIPFKARPYGVEFVDADGVAQARNSMHFGGAMFFTDYSMSAMELTRALEERGFESIWAPSTAPPLVIIPRARAAGRRDCRRCPSS